MSIGVGYRIAALRQHLEEQGDSAGLALLEEIEHASTAHSARVSEIFTLYYAYLDFCSSIPGFDPHAFQKDAIERSEEASKVATAIGGWISGGETDAQVLLQHARGISQKLPDERLEEIIRHLLG